MTVNLEALWANPNDFTGGEIGRDLLTRYVDYLKPGSTQLMRDILQFISIDGDTAWGEIISHAQKSTPGTYQEVELQVLKSIPYELWKLYMLSGFDNQRVMVPHSGHMDHFMKQDFQSLNTSLKRNIVYRLAKNSPHHSTAAWKAFTDTADDCSDLMLMSSSRMSARLLVQDMKENIWAGYLDAQKNGAERIASDNAEHVVFFLELLVKIQKENDPDVIQFIEQILLPLPLETVDSIMPSLLNKDDSVRETILGVLYERTDFNTPVEWLEALYGATVPVPA